MGIKVIIRLDPLEIEFDASDGQEAAKALLSESMGLLALASVNANIRTMQTTDQAVSSDTTTGATDSAEPVKRGRKPKLPEANAPPPLPVPVAAAAPAVLDNGIPAFLQKTAAAAPPPPPPLASAPPIAPAAPSFVVGNKVAAELRRRAEGAADSGQSLADWLASAGIVSKGATFEEAIATMQFTTDDKAQPLATALSV